MKEKELKFFGSFVIGFLKSKYPEILKEIEKKYKEVKDESRT